MSRYPIHRHNESPPLEVMLLKVRQDDPPLHCLPFPVGGGCVRATGAKPVVPVEDVAPVETDTVLAGEYSIKIDE